MNKVIHFSKEKYPEDVIRKSLYWLSEDCLWQLEENMNEWQVIISSEANIDNHIDTLHRILNDFSLRKALDEKTDHLRVKIISSALEKIAKGN